MSCEYCHGAIGHDCRCPNYAPPKAKLICSYCGDGIYDGEEYIENQDGEFRHCECSDSTRELVGWLGHEVKTMEEGF